MEAVESRDPASSARWCMTAQLSEKTSRSVEDTARLSLQEVRPSVEQEVSNTISSYKLSKISQYPVKMVQLSLSQVSG